LRAPPWVAFWLRLSEFFYLEREVLLLRFRRRARTKKMVPVYAFFVAALALIQSISSNAFAPSYQTRSAATTILFSQNGRRDFMSKAAIAAVSGVVSLPQFAR
jgi:hypothetical protein